MSKVENTEFDSTKKFKFFFDDQNLDFVLGCEAALHDFYVKKTRALDNAMSKVQQLINLRAELTPTSIDMVQAFLDGRVDEMILNWNKFTK